ncbi:aflatoxin B1-aldehyde reductase [Artomyces pyxidatus]|uniref:Aflatoxin B1-aldehyde reductase n=1 Tax=Artomyces pyxidatus TaxID=48021 RepID=A0ACB8T5R6_9AGAM|nr:aflatoxin B1-aldehyde reductase [Artomyces pyxidatus]
MASDSDARVPAVFGTATFGTAGLLVKTNTPAAAQEFIDILVKYGHSSIDTAHIYGQGTAEVLLSQLDLKGARVDTKIFPREPGYFAPKKFKELVQESVESLNGVKIRTLYLHAPDGTVPIDDTLSAVDELHKQGAFESFGISNYHSWEVSEIAAICRLKGYVPPTVYQGFYNCLDRGNEDELFPCLRKHNIRFAAYSPLAGGFLTNKHLADPTGQTLAANARFNPANAFSAMYTSRYGHTLTVLRELKALGDAHGLELNEIAVRWLVHHSRLRPSDVGVIYGASRPEQLEKSLDSHAKGPLPEEIVAFLEDAWLRVKVRPKASS